MTPKLSVVVCTFNRAEWLRGCLMSLEPQCADASLAEVLIVDNNSSDATRTIAEEFTSRLPNFRYIFEGAQGLSHARNRGIREARGDYVAYMDDDAKAHPNWTASIIRLFETTGDAAGAGGPYYPFSSVPIPAWFPKTYGRWTVGAETRKIRIEEGESINGMNMAFRKQALLNAGGFDPELGMAGYTVSYGEETNLVARMLARGMHVYYCASMVVDHAILPHKLKLRWLLKSSFAAGYDGVRTFNYQQGPLTYLPKVLRQALAVPVRFLRCEENHPKARAYHALWPLFQRLGFFVNLAGLQKRRPRVP